MIEFIATFFAVFLTSVLLALSIVGVLELIRSYSEPLAIGIAVVLLVILSGFLAADL